MYCCSKISGCIKDLYSPTHTGRKVHESVTERTDVPCRTSWKEEKENDVKVESRCKNPGS